MTSKFLTGQDISLRPQNVTERIVLESMMALIASGRELKLIPVGNEQGDVVLQVRTKEEG